MATSLLRQEFQKLRKFFSSDCLKMWRKGIRWIESNAPGVGILSWEPFFLGLLIDKKSFSSRALDALVNRRRLLYRLRKIESDLELPANFGMQEIFDEVNYIQLPGEARDFFPYLILKQSRKISPVDTEKCLQTILEFGKRVGTEDWENAGRGYLSHPGSLNGDACLLMDAIIGELIGSYDGFLVTLRSLINQHQHDVRLTIALRQGKLTVIPGSRFAKAKIGGLRDRLTAVEAAFTNNVHLVEHGVISEFEELINARMCPEYEIQKFLEAHPELLAFDGYVSIISHPVLTFVDDRQRIPDFFLEREDGFWDLLELKRPQVPIVVGPKNRRMLSSAIHRAIAQLKEYSSYYSDKKIRDSFRESTGVNIYQPNLVVLIGRQESYKSYEERSRLDYSLEPMVKLVNYDDILNVAKKKEVFVDRELSKKITQYRI